MSNYSKPQVTIDLEEYNELIKSKSEYLSSDVFSSSEVYSIVSIFFETVENDRIGLTPIKYRSREELLIHILDEIKSKR